MPVNAGSNVACDVFFLGMFLDLVLGWDWREKDFGEVESETCHFRLEFLV